MTTAVVFPGQGSQHPGMGKAFYDAWPTVERWFERLSNGLGEDLARLCFEADAETLRETTNTQPALFTVGLATYYGLCEYVGGQPAYVAGHSLGHFTALAAAGGLDPVDGVQLTRERGQALAAAADEVGPGKMVAALLVDPETVADACRGRDDVGVALYNSPRQTVISGTEEGIAAVKATLADTRARFRDLDVAAAFHSPVMAPAVDALTAAMERVDLEQATVPIVSDVSLDAYVDPAVARRDLSSQVTAPVDWHGVVNRVDELGVDRIVVAPPAGTLTGLIERIDPDATIVALKEPADADALEELDSENPNG